MDRKTIALEGFSNNMNCAQAVFCAFADDAGADRNTAFKTASCFGHGMRLGEVCGAATGALMAIGMKYGGEENGAAGKKAAEFMKKFKEKNGTVLCREILSRNAGGTACEDAISSAIEILEGIFEE